jgi:hypothetical protein
MLHFVRTTLRPPFLALCASLVISLLSPVGGSAQVEPVLWYGGDSVPFGFTNNTMVTAEFGTIVLDDFVVPNAAGWHITGLFSNNVAGYPIETAPFTQAVWSIRTAVGAGEPGNILFAGLSPIIITPTGRTFGEDEAEYTVTVYGLSIDLGPGVYFMNVSPIALSQNYYVGGSDGTHAVGLAGPNGVFIEDRAIVDGNLRDLVQESSPPPSTASMGVIGTVDQCADSDRSATVVVDRCNSGVTNTLFATGCTISDLISECATGASNHGQFVSCVAHLTNDLKKAGTITGQQTGAIQSCAAQAHIP